MAATRLNTVYQVRVSTELLERLRQRAERLGLRQCDLARYALAIAADDRSPIGEPTPAKMAEGENHDRA